MTSRYFVGIDLHKDVLQVCVLENAQRTVFEQRYEIETLEQGLAVVAALKRFATSGRFAVEAVGMNRWFVDACREAGYDIVVVDPTRLGLRMLGRKTDRRDAFEIARRLALGDIDQCARTYYPTTDEYGVRKLLRSRHEVVHIRQEIVNQIRSLLNAYKLVPPGTSLYLPKCLAWLRDCELPNADLGFVLKQWRQMLEDVQARIVEMDARIVERAKNDAAAIALQSIPSVGPQTALTLRYELGDVSRFKNARAVACAAGLVPRVSQSANTAHHGPLTKRGNSELRWIASEWAVRLLARNDLVKAWAAPYLRKKHKNKVRIALARRLLVGVFFTLKTGEEFSLTRCLAS
jgi:transposase